MPSSDPLPLRSRRRRSRARRWVHAAAVPLARTLVETLARTWRHRRRGDQHLMRLLAEDRPVVAVFWHAEAILCARELLLATPIAARARWTFLISPSVDGDAVTRLVERYGGRVVRGSATRTGRTALLRLTRELEAGSSVVVVPDGPSGPARVAKPGAAALAARAGSPLLPLAARASSAVRLTSWDRTVLPLPFARVAVGFGAPLELRPEREAYEQGSRELERSLAAVEASLFGD